MTANISITSSPIVSVLVTSTANPFGVQRRFERAMTISALKLKLELVTGAFSQSMKLSVFNVENKLVCKLDNNDALLGSYNIDDGMTLHAEDTNIQADEYSDTSKVEKFEISKDEYEARTDSVRAFKERNKLGHFNEELRKKKEDGMKQKEAAEEEKAKTLSVNDRCEVRVPGQPVRRAEVKYVGTTEFKAGAWVGIQYDEPHGKNDGIVGGKRYFTCPAKYGGFVRPSSIEVGDFPEEGLDFEDDEM